MFASSRSRTTQIAALGAATTLLAFSIGADAGAAVAPQPSAERHFDVRDRVAPNVKQTSAQRASQQQLNARVQLNPRLGVPFVVTRDGATLTRARAGDGIAIARDFLRDNAELFKLSVSDVGRLVADAYVTPRSGATYVTFEQRDGARTVFGSSLKVAVDRQGRVVIASGTLFPRVDAAADTPLVDAPDAIVRAARRVGVSSGPVLPAKAQRGRVLHYGNTVARGARPDDITAELVSFPVEPDQPARLAWKIELQTSSNADYDIVVDARSGDTLYRDNGVAHADGTVYTTQHPDSAGAARTNVTFPAGWVAARTTAGANVVAYQDATNTGTIEYQPQTPAAPDANFQRFNYGWANDWALNGPHTIMPAGTAGYVDIDAAITQMFYYTNIMHDYLVGFGFTAATRGFEGVDPVFAEATDGYEDGVATNCTSNGSASRCVDNANFNTSADGTGSRMQMYLWETPQRDSAMDGDIIAHEYGHGLSGRLIQDGNLGSAVQTGALGEGWSDIVSAAKWDDPVIGEYSSGNATNGLRTASMASSTLKYSNLCTIFAGTCEVHADGEIWAATWWDIRKLLIAKYDDDPAKAAAFQLIVDGMRSTPQGPTFLAARDNLLAANQTTRNGADFCLIWGAFAGREMGFSASTTGNGDMTPTTATDGPAACTPTAEAGGPYTTSEGNDVQLDASGSTERGDGPSTYAWDLDNDGEYDDATVQKPTFTEVGQDGEFTVAVKITNANGFSHTDSSTAKVTNVAPKAAAITTDAPRNENTTLQISGSISDPGWRDELSATIDFGDGAGAHPLGGTLENNRADATFTYAIEHTYGDDGTYTVKVCGADDDTTDNCAATTARVDNVTPTLTPDLGATTNVNGSPTFISHAGRSLTFGARATDPGSDDLRIAWDWGDGLPTPDVSTLFLVNSPALDALKSPSIQPRDIVDTQAHAFGGACLYMLGLSATDDDGGSASYAATVIITANATRNRSAGYWQTQYAVGAGSAFTAAQLECYRKIAVYMSRVFSERTDAATIARVRAILAPPTTKTTAEQQFDRQLLAAWLNFANGSIDLATPIDTDGNGTLDSTFGAIVRQAEAVRLSANPTKSQIVAQKDVLERMNLRDGG